MRPPPTVSRPYHTSFVPSDKRSASFAAREEDLSLVRAAEGCLLFCLSSDEGCPVECNEDIVDCAPVCLEMEVRFVASLPVLGSLADIAVVGFGSGIVGSP